MKNISFIVSLAIAIAAFADPHLLEERQGLPCLAALCALHSPLTLSGNLGFATSTSVGGLTVSLTATHPFTTIVGGSCCPHATCATPTGTTTIPTMLPVTATLPATITVPVPRLHTTLTVTLPSAGFSGDVTLPTTSLPSGGVSGFPSFSSSQ